MRRPTSPLEAARLSRNVTAESRENKWSASFDVSRFVETKRSRSPAHRTMIVIGFYYPDSVGQKTSVE
jgi:hypothetical protein